MADFLVRHSTPKQPNCALFFSRRSISAPAYMGYQQGFKHYTKDKRLAAQKFSPSPS
jgi:hypothetical protein